MDRSSPLRPHYQRAIELIGRRWTGAILFLLLRDRLRFSGLRAGIPEITDRMLSERLRELEEEGIVQREVVRDAPVRVEYSLTEKGRALARPVEAIGRWAEEWHAGTTGSGSDGGRPRRHGGRG
jgi:DNA-binding HxlR family transcriptional regulator